MKETLVMNGTEIIIDPMNIHPTDSGEAVMTVYGGIIPSFLDFTDERPLYEQATTEYNFYLGDFEFGKIDRETFIASYPGDPDLLPMVIFKRQIPNSTDIFVIYKFGFVAGFYTKGNEEVKRTCRMD